jgi:hypothetical protein
MNQLNGDGIDGRTVNVDNDHVAIVSIDQILGSNGGIVEVTESARHGRVRVMPIKSANIITACPGGRHMAKAPMVDLSIISAAMSSSQAETAT